LIKIGVDLVPFNEKNRVIFSPYVSVFGPRTSLTTKVSGDFFPMVHYSIKLKYIFILSKTADKKRRSCKSVAHARVSVILSSVFHSKTGNGIRDGDACASTPTGTSVAWYRRRRAPPGKQTRAHCKRIRDPTIAAT